MFRTLFSDRFMPFMEEDGGLSIGAGDEGAEGAEETEPAEPSPEPEGAEETEPAEPDEEGGKTSADAAFAEQRRRIAELEQQNRDYEEALGLFFEGDDKVVQAHALGEDKSEEQVKAELEAKSERERLQQENDELYAEIASRDAEMMMERDLKSIQAIDPAVKSLDELGDDYFDYIAGGLTGVQAYYATKAKAEAEKITSPSAPGRVNEKPEERDYFTKEEVENMTPEEVHKNYDKIRKSYAKW